MVRYYFSQEMHMHCAHIALLLYMSGMSPSTGFSASNTSAIRSASALFQPLAKIPLKPKVKHFKIASRTTTQADLLFVENRFVSNRVAFWGVRPLKAKFL